MKNPVLAMIVVFKIISVSALQSGLHAEIKDYQVRRMIFISSSCKLTEIKRTPLKNGGFKFHGTCTNLSFYPNGIDMVCSDPDIEASCKILTKSKSFDQLKLLFESVNQKHKSDVPKK